MFCYNAYGQEFVSAIELPELAPASDQSGAAPRGAVTIQLGAFDVDWNAMKVSESLQCNCAVGGDGNVYLSWPNVAEFRVREGREITISPRDGADPGLLRVITLGGAMAVLLHQQGVTVLHGSALEVHGRAVSFIGGKGFGKSTMAATLAQRGHRLLTDDLIAILKPRGDASYEALPSFSQLKLWPDAAEALGHAPDDLPKVTKFYDKVALRSSEMASASVALGPIIVLGIEDEFSIRKFSGQQALSQLLTHSYINRFGSAIVGDGASQLGALGSVANAVGVYKLSRPAGLERLTATAEQIEAFVANCAA